MSAATTMTQTTTLRQRAPTSSPSPSSSSFPSSSVSSTRSSSSSSSSSIRVPTVRPAFTIGDIRRVIPSHCFERSLTTSFRYLITDLLFSLLLFYFTSYIPSLFPDSIYGSSLGPLFRHGLWFAYWISQGVVLTGVWVIGHECGHGGFADQEWVNDSVGLVVHSFLLVPYFAWKISHRRHHSNTGSIEKDEVFVPPTATTPSDSAVSKEEEEPSMMSYTLSSFFRGFRIVIMLTLGWPMYLINNTSGNLSYDKNTWVNHFTPSSPIFATGTANHSNSHLILISDIALLTMIGILTVFSYVYSFTSVLYSYLIPYLIVNLFLVLITFLQHTSLSLPHYTSSEWDWLRGALATVDRSYGWILDGLFHHITDTHVVHHLFSSMPHYHAEEATRAVKGLLGDYYLFDETPIPEALWVTYGACREVKEDKANKGVWWY